LIAIIEKARFVLKFRCKCNLNKESFILLILYSLWSVTSRLRWPSPFVCAVGFKTNWAC